MKKTGYLAVLCLSTGLALPATAQTQQSQQPMGQQQLGQQPMGQQQFGQQQFGQQPTGQQKLTEQRIQNFFTQAEDVLQRTARSQDPAQLRQYLDQFLEPDATITSSTELYIGDRHVATTVAFATDETVTDALGYAATALQGRKLVSDYNIEISVQDIQIMPGQTSARVMTVIQEEGIFGGPIARAVAGRVGQARERIGELREQFQQDQGQWGRAQQDSQMGQIGQRLRQGWGQMQSRQEGMGGGMATGPGRGGAPEGIRFQTRANCTHDIMLDQGQIRIGNTFCRGSMRLG